MCMNVKEHLRDKLPLLVPMMRKAEEEEEKRALKWSRGKQGSVCFYTKIVRNGKKGWGRATPTADKLSTMYGLYWKGLLAHMETRTICIDEKLIPDAVVWPDRDDVNTMVLEDKRKLSNILGEVEKIEGVHILPLIKGKPVYYEGGKYKKFLAIKNLSGDMMADFGFYFSKAFSVLPNAGILNDFAKHLVYMATSVNEEGNFSCKVRVVPADWFNNELVSDGAIFYMPHRKPETLMTHHYKLGQHKLKLDGRTVHVRGISNVGQIAKGKISAVTPKFVHEEVKEAYKGLFISAMQAGDLICTRQTLKGASTGKHRIKFWYHNDSKANAMLGTGKLMFEQQALKLNFTNIDGLNRLYDKNVGELATAMSSGPNTCDYLLKNKEEYNSENLPVMEFTSQFQQVKLGLTFGINTSLIRSMRMAMSNVMKGVGELPAGIKRYFDKDGNVLFNFDEHNAIYLRGFIEIRSSLKRGEIGVPRHIYRKLMKIIDANGELAINDLVFMMRRMPITLTSIKKCIPVERKDDYGYLTISVEDAKDMGADSDGDMLDLLAFPKTLFDFENITSDEIGNLIGKQNEDSMNQVIKTNKWFSEKRASAMGCIPKNHNMLYELMASEGVGNVVWAADTLRYHLLKNNWSRNKTNILTYMMENGPINAVIDGKKWSNSEVFSIPACNRKITIKRVYGMPKGIGMLRGKHQFINTLEEMPSVISDLADEALDGYIPEKTVDDYGRVIPYPEDKAKADAEKHRNLLKEHYPVHYMILTKLAAGMPDTMEHASLPVKEYNTYRKGVRTLYTALVSRFGNLVKSPEDRGIGFIKTQYGTLSNIYLEDYKASMREYLDNQNIPTNEVYRAINALKAPTFKKIMDLCHSDTGRIATQLMLLCCAYDNTMRKDGSSSFSFIFNMCNSAVLKLFVEFIKPDGNPDTFFTELKDEPEEEPISAEGQYQIVKIRTKVVGDISKLGFGLIDPMGMDDREIVEDNFDELIILDEDGNGYQYGKTTGKPFHYFKFREDGGLYYNQYK